MTLADYVKKLPFIYYKILALEKFISTLTGGFTGWGSYKDTQYTDAAVFSLVGGAAYVNLPNNGVAALEVQKPDDVLTFYDGVVITGQEGDSLLITISFGVIPTTAQPTRVTIVPDIGGAVGQIEDYEVDVTFTKGSGVKQRFLKGFGAYTLDTWEANGAQMKVKADNNAGIYGVRYHIQRTHKAR